jgi:dolichol-phosphate mannosyltransferase
MRPEITVVIPVYDEGAGILPCLDRILAAVTAPCEVLVVYDRPDDTTVPYIEKVAASDQRVRGVLNGYGPGPANAIRAGFDEAIAPVTVVTMADGSDDPRQIDGLARHVPASRYMPGGQQVGGAPLKRRLSRWAGVSLRLLARVGTRDATNSFKAYSTEFVRQVGIDSRTGFEIGLELTAKATRLRLPVAEIPTIWLDRSAGESHFDLVRWLPGYLHWYRFAFGRRLTPDELTALRRAAEPPASAR